MRVTSEISAQTASGVAEISRSTVMFSLMSLTLGRVSHRSRVLAPHPYPWRSGEGRHPPCPLSQYLQAGSLGLAAVRRSDRIGSCDEVGEASTQCPPVTRSGRPLPR